jgi:hypothetical protein
MRAVAALLPLALLTVAACSGDDDGGSAGTGAGGADLATIAGGLASLPETGEPQERIVWGDVERATEVGGLDRPTEPGEAAVDYLRALTAGPAGDAGDAGDDRPVGLVTPEAAHVDRAPDQAELEDELGWSILDVDRFVERQTPPGVVTVLDGSFDESALTDALGEPDDDTWTAGTGEDFAQDLDEVSAARPIGESLWLGLDGDRLSVARSSGDSAAVRRAVGGSGGTPTVADDEALAAVARVLDAETPYAALLVRPGLSGVPERSATPSALEAACEQALPAAASAVGTAVADDDGPVFVLAFAHESPEAAEANAEALERIATEGSSYATNRPWSDLLSLDGVDVADDGRTVVARLRPREAGNAMLWYQIVLQQDSLVSSC